MSEKDEFFDVVGDISEGASLKRPRVSSPGKEQEEVGDESEVRIGLREVRDVMAGVKEMGMSLKLVLERLSKVEEGFKRVEDQLKEEKEESRKLREEVRCLREENEERERRFVALEGRVIDQEARSRRNNLIIHGLEETEKEECVPVVKKLFMEKCNVDNIIIERAHRIGAKKGDKTRPMIVRFLDYNDKIRVKDERKSLPDGVYLADDFPFEIRQARAQLVPKQKEAKNAGRKAWIAYPARLIVDGEEVESVRPSASKRSDAADNAGNQQGQAPQGLRGAWQGAAINVPGSQQGPAPQGHRGAWQGAQHRGGAAGRGWTNGGRR